MVEALVGSERRYGWKPSDRQIPWHLLRIWHRLFCIGHRTDIDSLDILFYRGRYYLRTCFMVVHISRIAALSSISISIRHETNAKFLFYLGFPQVAW